MLFKNSAQSTQKIHLRLLFKDFLLWVALLTAPLFWAVLFFYGNTLTDPDWLKNNIWLFLQLAMLYPIVEELVFRGLLQEWLWQTNLSKVSIYHLSLPNITTSIIFTGFHFLSHTPLWALMVIIPSLIFGFFRDRYQSVIPAIVLHLFYNSGYFLLFGK